MKLVNLLSMTFILLGFGKVGFCEMFAKRGTLQRVEVRSWEKKFSKNKSIIFRINYVTH